TRNLIQPDEFPYDVGLISRDNSPRRYDSGNYPECLRRVAEAVGADGFAAEREQARAAGRAIGLGFALFVEDTGLGPYEGVRVRGTPGRGLALGDVAAIATTPRPGYALPGGMDPGLEATGYVHVLQSTYSNGAHAAVVEVDPETGTVRILKYVAVDDCGTMINPMVVEGQIHGGIAHGIGNALLEEIVYDGAGQLVTGTLMDYALPRASDVPRLEVHHVVTPSPLNPLGIKGAGEGGTLPAPAALANAVADALRPLGVEVTEMPLTRERLWRRVRAAASRPR